MAPAPVLKPKALKKGAVIGVMAPSTRVDRGGIGDGIRTLYDLGYEVVVHEQTFTRNKSSAGRTDEKMTALYELLSMSQVDGVIAAKGGNHALDLLDRLDYKFIRKHAKMLMGFSDTTGLLNAVHARAGIVTCHGPTLAWMNRVKNPELIRDLWSGKKIAYPMSRARTGTKRTHATGRMVGGNLSLITGLMGTPYMPDCRGAILFLEDIGEETSRIDRMFVRLRLGGVLESVAGIVLGQFSDCTDTGKTRYGFTLNDMIETHFAGLDIPVIINAPFGHTADLAPMPVGGMMKISTLRGKPALTLAEPAVSI